MASTTPSSTPSARSAPPASAATPTTSARSSASLRQQSAEEGDGRRARRGRNQSLVLDAVLELFTEGDLHPHPDAVAERSGISVRSIYRYFPTPEAMWRSAMDQHFERVRPLFDPPEFEGLDLESRIEVLVQSRLTLHGEIAAVARAARLSAVQSKAVSDRFQRSREYLRSHIELIFASELSELDAVDRQLTIDAIDSAIQVDALDYLKLQRGLNNDQIVDVLSHTVRSVLTGSTRAK